MPKKRVKAKRKSTVSKKIGKYNEKFQLAGKNLVFFFLISLVFAGLYFYSEEIFYSNMFLLISMISGSIALAFLVALIIFLFLKAGKKK